MSKGLAPKIIDWIYAQQVHPYTDPATGEVDLGKCGFRGGTALGVPFEPLRTRGHSPADFPHDHGHITMTYTALCNLRILGDASFSRVNRGAIIGALAHLQQADGSFSSTAQRSESDMRFLYCACAISSMLADWTGFDVERSVCFIAASQSYDGGVGLWPGCEGHGGSTYCAVASLTLMNKYVLFLLRVHGWTGGWDGLRAIASAPRSLRVAGPCGRPHCRCRWSRSILLLFCFSRRFLLLLFSSLVALVLPSDWIVFPTRLLC